MRRALCYAMAAAAAATAPIPGQQPQLGNGFVAAFVNASSAYVAGVFSGAATESTRAGIPNALRAFVACPNTSAFAVNESAGYVSLRGVCEGGAVHWEQRWFAAQHLKTFVVSEIL